MRLFYLCAEQGKGEPARVGVTVGKRIAGAARRVRGRRVLRESLRRLLPWMKDDVMLVASMKEAGLRADAPSVYLDLAKASRRACLLKEDWPGANWEVDSPCSDASPRR